MKLYIARHAEAIGAEINPKRPLTEQGKIHVERIADFLAPMGVLVSRVYHSGVLRAQQTAEILAGAIAPGQSFEAMPLLTDPDGVQILAAQTIGWADDTLLVGHIPFMPRLVSELVVQNENQTLVDFQPATLVCLQRIGPMRWCILWALQPDIIPDDDY